jgi:hypothetical protein
MPIPLQPLFSHHRMLKMAEGPSQITPP